MKGSRSWQMFRLNPRRRQWHPTPVLLPGESHGWRSLEGCSPWGHWGLDMTERLPFQFSLSCIGEGNGNPLQCSCLENPRDGGAWWAAVYGVTQSWTRLKRPSSSSSSRLNPRVFRVSEDGCYQTCIMEASAQVWNNLLTASLDFPKKLYDFQKY